MVGGKCEVCGSQTSNTCKTLDRTAFWCGCGKVVHGGKRKGSGRKPRADGQGRTVPKSIKVSRDVADYLGQYGTGIIEEMIRRSAAFKKWKGEGRQ